MRLFNRNSDIKIVLENNVQLPVRLAAEDLQKNLRQLSGQEAGFEITDSCFHSRCIRVCTVPTEKVEAYTVCVKEDCVEITGSDVLGTVYGIYAFATRCLGILPVYRMTDSFPAQTAELDIAPVCFSSQERKVRFRGWFINDEDLLTEFKYSGGKRRLEYPFYQDVMDVSVLDMVLETALRLEINLIIPSTLVDIRNPEEEKLVKATTDRGLYISQHHIEPLGVSFFAIENYFKDHGIEGEEVSFLSNRARMEEIWRCYAEKWAVYGDRVVYQLGLRGKGDRPVWHHDPNVPDSDAARGAIIADAIATQHRIIAEALGHENFHSSTTLWMESARLYGLGFMPVPENTVVVFSDIGFSQMYGGDFYNVPRQPGQHYGIYYHVGYWVEGPHLTEGCDLRKMAFSYKEALEHDTLYYSVLNASNVRPLHSSVWYNATLLSDPENIDPDTALTKQLTAIYGDHAEAVKALTWEYYDCIADLGKEELMERCQRHNFHYHEYGELDFPLFPATDGFLNWFGRKFLRGNYFEYVANDPAMTDVIRKSLPKWESLYEKAVELDAKLPESCKEYFGQFFKYPVLHMLQMTRWYLAGRTMIEPVDRTQLDRTYEDAQAALASILDARKILEKGQWELWHRGERKINVAQLVTLTKEFYEKKINA